MARKARKLTEAQRAEIEADRIAAAEKTGVYAEPAVEEIKQAHEEVVVLDPTPEGIELMKRAIAEGKTARFRGEAGHSDEEVDAAEKAADAEEKEVIFEPDGDVFKDADEKAEAIDKEISGEDEPVKSGGVVKDVFKKRYVEQAVARGDTSKHAKRSNWDWLAQQLATFCLKKDGKIDIGAFTDVLDANGVDHSKWTNRNRGWEGRFRMTGRVALQKIVATAGELKWPGDAEPTPAPKEWCDTILKRQS